MKNTSNIIGLERETMAATPDFREWLAANLGVRQNDKTRAQRIAALRARSDADLYMMGIERSRIEEYL